MDNIQKIPFFMAVIAALITGMLSNSMRMNLNQTCIRMIAVLVIFFIIGLLARNTLIDIINNNEMKRIQAEYESKIASYENKLHEEEKNSKVNTPIFDVKVDDEFDEFTPINLSEAFKSKMMR